MLFSSNKFVGIETINGTSSFVGSKQDLNLWTEILRHSFGVIVYSRLNIIWSRSQNLTWAVCACGYYTCTTLFFLWKILLGICYKLVCMLCLLVKVWCYLDSLFLGNYSQKINCQASLLERNVCWSSKYKGKCFAMLHCCNMVNLYFLPIECNGI